jgi:hypothetical protein
MVPSLKHFCYCLKTLPFFCPIKTVRELGRYLVLWYINLLVFYSTIEIGKILRFEVC